MIESARYPLLWIDLEFTDLDVKKGRIVEIATIITDASLNIKATGPDLVIHQPESVLADMLQWNQKHFGDSGLLDEIRVSKISHKRAEEETLKFIKKHAKFQEVLLAGSSVQVDREYLGEHMPSIYNYLHHHIIDVNTIEELKRRWYPNVPEYPKNRAHRSIKDIIDSIDELKYYREHLFK